MSGLATTFALGRRRKAGSVGRPSTDTEMRIANPDERGVGEVQFRGPSVIRGYWNDPDATAAAIDREGWLSTGDLGYLDEDGDLFLVDRKKELIIRGGYNVYPREVEEVLYEHPRSSRPPSWECPTVARRGRRRDRRPAARSRARSRRAEGVGEGARGGLQVPSLRRAGRRAPEEPNREDPQTEIDLGPILEAPLSGDNGPFDAAQDVSASS